MMVAMPDHDQPRRRWLRGWRVVALATLALVLVVVGGLGWWLNDERHLHAPRARAAALGLVPSTPHVPAASARIAQASEVEAALAALTEWKALRGDASKTRDLLAQRAILAQLDPGRLSDLIAALARLGPEPLHPAPGTRPIMLDRSSVQVLLRLRWRTAESGEAAIAAGRSLVRLFPTDLDTDCWAMYGLLQRLDLMTLARRIVPEGLRSRVLADEIEERMDAAWSVYPAAAAESAGAIVAAFDASDPIDHLAWSFGSRQPRYEGEYRLWRAVVVRCAAAPALDLILDGVARSRRVVDAADLLRDLGPPSSERCACGHGDWNSLATLSHSQADGIPRRFATQMILGGLLVAELRGQPWPTDPHRPDERLRPIVRAGRIIAAYGAGPDGVDDSGDRARDLVWVFDDVAMRAIASSPTHSHPH